MNPPCAKCKKTVYPVEKLTCLDKPWHKACFRCTECNLALTMKTYKGYNKMPYCNTHYPTTRFTQVADTPEGRRLTEQSARQSEVVYRKDYRDQQGKYQGGSDSVEMRTASQASRLASQAQYRQDPPEMSQAPSYHQPPPQSYNQPPPQSYHQPPPQSYNPPPSQPSYHAPPSHFSPPPVAQPPPSRPAKPRGPYYIAQFDYSAADSDEVSFQEGDAIINAELVAEGWMTGTVERTGESGMLPSNYVEPGP